MQESETAYADLPPLRIERSNDRVYESLRDAITDGVLAPGRRLVEAHLAARLGVSRAPVREAIRVLEREGLVHSVPRRGTTVSILSREDVREIYELRTALESWAARTVAASGGTKEIEELESLVRDMDSASHRSDRELLSGQDVRFHLLLCELAGNARLSQVWLGIVGQIRLLSRQVIGTLYRDLAEVPHRHEAIVSAIRSGDGDAATQAVRAHIGSVADRIVAAFPDADGATARVKPQGNGTTRVRRGKHPHG